MNEPLMSTPMNMTSRGVGTSGAFAPWPPSFGRPLKCGIEFEEQLVASSAMVRIAILSARMSGHLLVARVAQLRLERAGVLEVLDAVEREVEQMPVRAQHGDEVERRRDHLHRRHDERVEQLLAL